MGVEITKRDKKIFNDLSRCRIATDRQFRKLYWKKDNGDLIHLNNVKKRLRELEKAGFVEKKNIWSPREQKTFSFYTLTEIGSVHTQNTNPSFGFKDTDIENVDHDYTISKIYFDLEEKERESFVTCSQSRIFSVGGSIPDAYRIDPASGNKIIEEVITANYSSEDIAQKQNAWESAGVQYNMYDIK